MSTQSTAPKKTVWRSKSRKHLGMHNEFEVRGDHVAIFAPKRGGGIAEVLVDLIDFEDVRAVAARWWAVQVKRKNGKYSGPWYARADVWNSNKCKSIFMHRLLLGYPSGRLGDHRDGDGLNNRRDNLRATTFTINNLNRSGARRDSGTGIRGVQRDGKRYFAGIQIAGVRHNLGRFDDPEEAGRAVQAFLTERGLSR